MATAVDQKLQRQTKFPPEFTQKVDMKKVNVEVMKKWIARRLSEILGVEDDVVIELCFNLLESSRFPDIKSLQIQLTGFLDKDTARFCKELWNLCLSAQQNAQGVPKELLEAKKQELMQEKADAAKAAEQMQQQKTDIHTREQNLDMIRTRERAERGRGRGGREPRSFDSRKPRHSRSPPRFRPLPRTEKDSYVPGANHRRGPPRARSPTRSLSRSSSSRSRSPPRKQRRRDDSAQAASRSPPPRRRRRSNSPSNSHRDRRPTRQRSISRSRSPPRNGGNRHGRGRPPSHPNSPETQRTDRDRQADIVRPRPRDNRRLSRSPSIDRGRQPRRRRNSSSIPSSRSSSSDSGSSHGRSGEQTRRRSRTRYEPRRRRRSSPSMSLSPEPKRRKRAASNSSRSPVAVGEQDPRASAEQNAADE